MMKLSPQVAIVDDEEPVRRALLRLMRSVAIPAKAFASGRDFFSSLASNMPDCVVLDLHLPDMNGFEIQARLKLEYPEIAVIIVTGQHSLEAQLRASLHSPLAYLLKPMNDQALLDAISLAGQVRRPSKNVE
jgi:FixJ family two-component response regulator